MPRSMLDCSCPLICLPSRSPAISRRRASAIVAIVFACLFAGCDSQSFQYAPESSPPAPIVPPQAPPAPLNEARMLNGNWMATYPGGPLRVVISLDPMLLGRNYVATLVDGSKTIPAGQVIWRGILDPNVPGLVLADQVCADNGFVQARMVKARILVRDPSHFTEDLVNPKDCHGFPVNYVRVGPAPTAPQRD